MVGLLVGNLWQPGAGLHIAPASSDEKAVARCVSNAKALTIVHFLMKMIPSNLVGAVAQEDLLPVLVIAVLFGFALCHMGERGQRLVSLIDDVMHALFGIVLIIMYVAPLAAFGAIAFTIGKFGFGVLASLGQLVASIYLTSILFVLFGFGAIAWIFGLRLLQIIRYFKDELLIAFIATSGEAMIPRSIEKLRRMGCAVETVDLVLPTGFSFKTDGTAIYMTMAVLFIAQALDIELTLGQQLMMLFVMLFTSKGAAGVAGAGFVALAATLPTLGILAGGGPDIAVASRALHVRDPRRHQSVQQHLRDGRRVEVDGRTEGRATTARSRRWFRTRHGTNAQPSCRLMQAFETASQKT